MGGGAQGRDKPKSGHVFMEDELLKFIVYKKNLLQDDMKKWPQRTKEKFKLNMCSTVLGNLGWEEKDKLPYHHTCLLEEVK